MLERVSLTTLAEDRQLRIQSLVSLLEHEKTINTKLQQSLNKANKELLRLKKEKDMHDQNYSEALGKVKEFRILYHQSQEKVKEIEAELISKKAELSSMKASISKVEELLRKRNEEIRMAENALKEKSVEVGALKTRIVELEKVNSIIFS